MSREFWKDDSNKLSDDASHWWSTTLESSPHLLALRERTLPWTGGFSYARLKQTGLTASLQPINRHVILEFIIQHLISIGMHQTADKIIEETGHKYQLKPQPWQKTDLMILVSMGVLPREDPWHIPEEPNVQYVFEPLEEDFFSAAHFEDPEQIGRVILDTTCECLWVGGTKNTEFEDLKASSLNWIVLHLVDQNLIFTSEDKDCFFLTLNTITSCMHFFEHLRCLFTMSIADERAKEKVKDMKGIIQIEILKLIRSWVDYRGLFIGYRTLRAIQKFCDDPYDQLSVPGNNEDDSDDKMRKEISKMIHELIGTSESHEFGPDLPCISNPQILFSPNLTVLDADPKETARQISLLAHAAFKTVPTREVWVALQANQCTLQTPTLREFLDTQKSVGELVLETFLRANDKKSAFDRVLEIARNLEEMGNYQSLYNLMTAFLMREDLKSALQSRHVKAYDEFVRIGTSSGAEPWKGSAAKSDSAHIQYVRTIKKRLFGDQYFVSEESKGLPAIPNVELDLKHSNVTEKDDFINGLINWQKRRQIATTLRLFYKSQKTPYAFYPIPQIQKVIKRGIIYSLEEIEAKANQWARPQPK